MSAAGSPPGEGWNCGGAGFGSDRKDRSVVNFGGGDPKSWWVGKSWQERGVSPWGICEGGWGGVKTQHQPVAPVPMVFRASGHPRSGRG